MMSGAQAGAAAAASAGGGGARPSPLTLACTILSKCYQGLLGSSARAEAMGFARATCGPSLCAPRALRASLTERCVYARMRALQTCHRSSVIAPLRWRCARFVACPAAPCLARCPSTLLSHALATQGPHWTQAGLGAAGREPMDAWPWHFDTLPGPPSPPVRSLRCSIIPQAIWTRSRVRSLLLCIAVRLQCSFVGLQVARNNK